MNFYNENDPKAAAWLRELIKADLIADGVVDERSITEIKPDELAQYRQCHFFAGIGGWSLALRLAGWPDDEPVWTGSCPCQPFSVAGKREGENDKRHLWPVFRELIRGQPEAPIVFGEQVASKDGRLWLSRVRADLEEMGYAVGAADLCAAGVGAPHIRQRLFWVAEHESYKFQRSQPNNYTAGRTRPSDRRRDVFGVEHSNSGGFRSGSEQQVRFVESSGESAFGLADSDGKQAFAPNEGGFHAKFASGRIEGCWDQYSICHFIDGKIRRIEPGTQPVAHGVPARVVRLRGYGNAIVPQVAAEFIQASVEAITESL